MTTSKRSKLVKIYVSENAGSLSIRWENTTNRGAGAGAADAGALAGAGDVGQPGLAGALAELGQPGPAGAGVSAPTGTFSRSARYRLLKLIMGARWTNPRLLTFSYHHPVAWVEFCAHWKKIRKSWGIFSDNAPAVWRLEFQRRGVPHLHLLTENTPPGPVAAIRWAWLLHSGQAGDVWAERYAFHASLPYSKQSAPGLSVFAYVAGHAGKRGHQASAPAGIFPKRWYHADNLVPVGETVFFSQWDTVKGALLQAGQTVYPRSWGGWSCGVAAEIVLADSSTVSADSTGQIGAVERARNRGLSPQLGQRPGQPLTFEDRQRARRGKR